MQLETLFSPLIKPSCCKDNKTRANPGGSGPDVTAGTLGVAAGVMLLAGCLVAAGAELEADAESLSEPAEGLASGADEAPECTGVSEPD